MTLHRALHTPRPRCIIDGEDCIWIAGHWTALADLRARLEARDAAAIRATRAGRRTEAALAQADADHIRTILKEADMTPTTMHDPLTAFLHRTEGLCPDDLHDAFATEVIEQGGTWLAPGDAHGLRDTSHLVEIALHGITGRGTSEAQAIDDWRAAARRTLTDAEG